MESVSTAVRGALSSLPGQQYLTIPALPTFRQPAPETASSDTEEEEEEDISLAFLRSKCDRLTERRATDFSQVDNIS